MNPWALQGWILKLETLCEWFLPLVLYVVLCLLSIQARLPRQPFYRCETQKTAIAFLCNTNGAEPHHWHHQNCSFTGHQKLTFWLILPFVLRDPNLPLFTVSQDQGMRVGDGPVAMETDSFPVIELMSRKQTVNTETPLSVEQLHNV